MAGSATLDPAAVGSLARIEAMLATANAELHERLEVLTKGQRGMAAELIDLRRQLATGKAREWLSIRAASRRFDVSRGEVQRAIAAGEVVTRPHTSNRGYASHEIHVDSARALWGGS